MPLGTFGIAGQFHDLFVFIVFILFVAQDEDVIDKSVLQYDLDIGRVVFFVDRDRAAFLVERVARDIFIVVALVGRRHPVLPKDDAQAFVYRHEFILHHLQVPRTKDRVLFGTCIFFRAIVGSGRQRGGKEQQKHPSSNLRFHPKPRR